MKKVLFISFCVISIASIVLICILIKGKGLQTFNMSDYQAYIDAYSADLTLEPIKNSENAKAQAEIIWTNFNQDIALDSKPYVVFYDSRSDAWLVEGTLPQGYIGGVPHMIVLSNGKVMASWIDK